MSNASKHTLSTTKGKAMVDFTHTERKQLCRLLGACTDSRFSKEDNQKVWYAIAELKMPPTADRAEETRARDLLTRLIGYTK